MSLRWKWIISRQRANINALPVLHQPSYQVFEMFDDVIFLARGGSSVYVGAAKDAASFFTEVCGELSERVLKPAVEMQGAMESGRVHLRPEQFVAAQQPK